jgi:hypothetical protein
MMATGVKPTKTSPTSRQLLDQLKTIKNEKSRSQKQGIENRALQEFLNFKKEGVTAKQNKNLIKESN